MFCKSVVGEFCDSKPFRLSGLIIVLIGVTSTVYSEQLVGLDRRPSFCSGLSARSSSCAQVTLREL